MKRRILTLLAAAAATFSGALGAEPVASLARTINVGAALADNDVNYDRTDETVASRVAALVGQEARRRIETGSPLREADFRTAMLVARNGPVTMVFESGPLSITTQGRSLSNGAMGDAVKVINFDSKIVVSGVVVGRGKVAVR